jgi:hypothetical protein
MKKSDKRRTIERRSIRIRFRATQNHLQPVLAKLDILDFHDGQLGSAEPAGEPQQQNGRIPETQPRIGQHL